MSKKRTRTTNCKIKGTFTVRGQHITSEARDKIAKAIKCKKKILVQNTTLFPEVMAIVAKSGVEVFQVVLDEKHSPTDPQGTDNPRGLLYGT